jgi:hypothetical protein
MVKAHSDQHGVLVVLQEMLLNVCVEVQSANRLQ